MKKKKEHVLVTEDHFLATKQPENIKLLEVLPDGTLRTYDWYGELALEIKPNQQDINKPE